MTRPVCRSTRTPPSSEPHLQHHEQCEVRAGGPGPKSQGPHSNVWPRSALHRDRLSGRWWPIHEGDRLSLSHGGRSLPMCWSTMSCGGIRVAGRFIAPKAGGKLYKLDTRISASAQRTIRAPGSESLQRPTPIDRKFQSHRRDQAHTAAPR